MATKGIVKGIVSNLVTVEVDGPVSQNEICYISVGGVKLMSEVIKVIGKNAFVQVFESTRGMRVGDEAEFQGHMLEVTLGPGMLSRNYDGLQNDLDKMEGVFLKRGDYTFALDNDKKWDFKPLAKAGDTVSAGDWLGEVDENTKKVARCFYALEQERADRKRYPAVNPIESYSKYIEYPEFQEYIAKHISPEWIEKVNEIKTRMLRGKEISEQINILGDDGVPVEYHVTFWKSELIDFVILQQDAFDAIDAVTPLQRQEFMLDRVVNVCRSEFKFDTFLEVMDYFKKMINIFKQMNYSEYESDQFKKFNTELDELLKERIEN